MKLRKVLMAACLALAGHSALSQTFGAPVIDRPLNDLAFQITFIGDHAAPAAGEITEWQVWAGAAGELKLQIWRPITGGYMLIGSNIVNINSFGLNILPIATGRIVVEVGDVIGFRYNQTTMGPRIIDYTPNDNGGYRWTNWPDPNTDVANGGIIQNVQLLGAAEEREYSVAATVGVPEPATIGILAMGTLALLLRRRKA